MPMHVADDNTAQGEVSGEPEDCLVTDEDEMHMEMVDDTVADVAECINDHDTVEDRFESLSEGESERLKQELQRMHVADDDTAQGEVSGEPEDCFVTNEDEMHMEKADDTVADVAEGINDHDTVEERSESLSEGEWERVKQELLREARRLPDGDGWQLARRRRRGRSRPPL